MVLLTITGASTAFSFATRRPAPNTTFAPGRSDWFPTPTFLKSPVTRARCGFGGAANALACALIAAASLNRRRASTETTQGSLLAPSSNPELRPVFVCANSRFGDEQAALPRNAAAGSTKDEGGDFDLRISDCENADGAGAAGVTTAFLVGGGLSSSVVTVGASHSRDVSDGLVHV